VLAECGTRRSAHKAELRAAQDGYVFIDALKAGLAGVILGVGRSKTTDAVHPDAGMILRAVSGDRVKKGDVIMEVFGKDETCLAPALALLDESIVYSEEKPKAEPLIYKEIN
jgi:pyrimidine-nucleoside phosphorylase